MHHEVHETKHIANIFTPKGEGVELHHEPQIGGQHVHFATSSDPSHVHSTPVVTHHPVPVT